MAKRKNADPTNRSNRAIRVTVMLALWTFVSPALFATTLVVKLETGRILLAADTRQERINPGSVAISRSAGGDERCKIRSFGSIGFALTGFIEYKGGESSSALPDWSANSDAADAFAKAGDNIREVAADWGQRAAAHFAVLNRVHPEWLKQLAGTNPQSLLQVAFFVGWDKQAPIFLLELVSFDPSSASGIQVTEQSRPIGDAPFSTNAITQELIDGATDRAQHAADTWDAGSDGIATQDLGWRHVEFYIEKTAAYDDDVSSTVDVLAIPVGRPPVWLKKSACP
jgi:hypothetical protein